MSLLPLDGPSKQFAVALTDSTAVEVKDGANPAISERKIITILPTDGKIYIYFGNGVDTPTANDIQTKGFPHPKGAIRSYEATNTQDVWIVADTGTVDVRIAERS
jgi:hypothetical protein